MNIMKKILLGVLSLLVVLSLSARAETSGQHQTDVTNRPAATSQVNTNPAPGDNDVVVQDVDVSDPGAGADSVRDGFDTQIETITVKKVSPSTLEDRHITRLRLFRENGLSSGFQPTGTSQDELLGEMLDPNLTAGVTFGNLGELLVRVFDGTSERFYIVADFAQDSPNNATFRTSFDMTVADDLVGGDQSSGLDPLLARLPLYMSKGAVQFIRLTSTRGVNQTDVIDFTQPTKAKPGMSIVVQQFRIEDPGALGNTTPDGRPTAIKDITVSLAANIKGSSCNPAAPVNPCISKAIKRLRLFRESPASPPGFQDPEKSKTASDELLGSVDEPDLRAGVTFFNPSGRPLVLVAEGIANGPRRPETVYVVADFNSNGLINGQRLRTEVFVTAKDMRDTSGELIESSNIETPMPLEANNDVEIEVPAAALTIGSVVLDLNNKTSKVCVSVNYIPKPGLGDLQIGPNGAITFDPQVVEVLDVHGVNGYKVDSFEVDPAGKVRFAATLKSQGREAVSDGCVVEIEVAATPDALPGAFTKLQVRNADNVEEIDAFRTADGADLDPDVISGSVFIKPICGDVDGDGAVTINDARMLAKFILGLEDLSPEQLALADVAPPTGSVDASDVRYIAQGAAKLRTLNCEVEAPIPTGTASQVRPWASTDLSRFEGLTMTPRVYAISGVRGLEFKVFGASVLAMQVEIFGLDGKRLYLSRELGNHLSVALTDREQFLPNGVYFYVVRVQDLNGRTVQLKTNKLVIVR
ncbi:hypothetical protein HYR54_07890 [Candidatus Acetothermia bacterium]|nr:hypothetical protein [Candidatus Acetothermia bacterium]